MTWSPYKELMRHFLVLKPTQIYGENSPSSYFFEKGLVEPKVYSSLSVSPQWLEVCTSWHFTSAYDLIMLLVSSYDRITRYYIWYQSSVCPLPCLKIFLEV